jgi:rubrerythrin
MKPYDPKTAISVWDRVKSAESSAGDAPAILNLIEEELADAATYLRLAKKLPPPQAAIARQLSQQEQSHAVCLKGIYSLITGRKALVPQPVISDDPPEIVLRRCYGREMRCLAQYEARVNDPEYGPVFARLAAQEREHCMAVLELIGRLKKE